MLQSCSSGGGSAAMPDAPGTTAQPSNPPPSAVTLRVYYDPYSNVDWSTTQRLMGQHHDHAGTSQTRISAYDRAGYAAIGLQTYSGNAALSYAWTARRWPPSQWLPPSFIASLTNIRFFIPNAEEVGLLENHFTSPFLTTYIELAQPGQLPVQPFQYQRLDQMITLIASLGGVPCMSHPWEPLDSNPDWTPVPCIEIYSAFAEAKREQADAYFTAKDRNLILVRNWDLMLRTNPRVLGIAVNDHFGPDAREGGVSQRVRDSGKIVVLAAESTLTAYEASFRRGAFFAIRDTSLVKGAFPNIQAISVESTSILIDTASADDTVTWIANTGNIGQGSMFELARLPRGATYLRAQVANAAGAVVYTQAFTLRPVGDSDGDGDVDAQDTALCDQVAAGSQTQEEIVAACGA